MKEFSTKAEDTIASYMKEKKVSQRKKNILTFEDMNVEYAMVEASKK